MRTLQLLSTKKNTKQGTKKKWVLGQWVVLPWALIYLGIFVWDSIDFFGGEVRCLELSCFHFNLNDYDFLLPNIDPAVHVCGGGGPGGPKICMETPHMKSRHHFHFIKELSRFLPKFFSTLLQGFLFFPNLVSKNKYLILFPIFFSLAPLFHRIIFSH